MRTEVSPKSVVAFDSEAAGLRASNPPAAFWALAVVLLAQGVVTAVLSALHVRGVAPPCFGGAHCGDLTSLPASRLFGMPIACYGFAAVVGQLALLYVAVSGPTRRRRPLWALWCVALTSAAVSGTLLLYATFVVHTACLLCSLNGVLAVAGLVAAHRALTHADRAPLALRRVVRVGSLVALACASALSAALLRADRRAMAGGWLAQDLPLAVLAPPTRPAFGHEGARLTLVLFSDPLCPACQEVLLPLAGRLGREGSPRVRLVYRHFLLRPADTRSLDAAVLLEWAHEHGRFGAALDLVRATKGDPARFLAGLTKIGLSPVEAKGVLASRPRRAAYERVIREDDAVARRCGATGTPYWVIVGQDNKLGWALGEGIWDWLTNNAAPPRVATPRLARPRSKG